MLPVYLSLPQDLRKMYTEKKCEKSRPDVDKYRVTVSLVCLCKDFLSGI